MRCVLSDDLSSIPICVITSLRTAARPLPYPHATSRWSESHSHAGLFLPSLSVQADHQKPQAQRYLPNARKNQNVGVQRTYERWRQKQNVAPTGQGHQHAKDARQEGGPENEDAD